jgi:hypothetical protein
MKKIVVTILSVVVLFAFSSCEDDSLDFSYEAPLSIGFVGVDNSNIVTVDKGVMNYTARVEVSTQGTSITYFEIYNADNVTGARGSLIEGTGRNLMDAEGNGVPSFSTEFVVENLVENKCIKVVATDLDGNFYERNLLVQITPSVIFTLPVKMETVEDYYGPYFASWLNGRVYMRRNGAEYASEIDFSMGDVVIPEHGTNKVPALVNPAARSTYDLLTMPGLQQTKFALTDLTVAQYNAINRVDASPITSLPDPTQDVVRLENGKVYLFKTANGKKGLIHISALPTRTGTIENNAGEWVQNTSYSQATLTVKVSF